MTWTPNSEVGIIAIMVIIITATPVPYVHIAVLTLIK